MFGLASKGVDSAPPYEELESQPRTSLTGYTTVPQTDTHLDEEHQEHQHQPQPQRQFLGRCGASPLPPPSTFQPHVHCDQCDGFLTRQQKVRSERFVCGMVALTFIVAFVCALLLGVAIVNSRPKDGWNH